MAGGELRFGIVAMYMPTVIRPYVYLCQELFLMLFHETGKNIFKIALVIENVTLSNPGLWESQQSSNLASLGIGDDGEP